MLEACQTWIYGDGKLHPSLSMAEPVAKLALT
jgi:hypothetical protein